MTTRTKKLGWVLFAGATFVMGCGGGTSATGTTDSTTTTAASSGGEHHAASTTAPTGNLVANGQAHVGDRTNCPVSGEEFVVTASSPTVEHEGRTYYMCCPGCAGRFRANPQQYIQQMQQRAAQPAATPAASSAGT
jgi:xanthine dehydrogenase accessory factor